MAFSSRQAHSDSAAAASAGRLAVTPPESDIVTLCPRRTGTMTCVDQPHKEHTMGMMKEFKEFAVKGNVIDLAVGVIIGAAFAKIVDSVVSDLVLPLVGAVIGKLDFSNLFVVLGTVPAGTVMTLDALKKAGVPVFAYGNFITVAVNFAILAFIIFLMIKQINRLKKETPAAPAVPPEDVVLLREIRDSLRK